MPKLAPLQETVVLEERGSGGVSATAGEPLPRMPCFPEATFTHRPKIGIRWYPFIACVARNVSKSEMERMPKALKAKDAEWDRLRVKIVWGEDNPREWADVRREADQLGIEVHMGYLFGICVEKNSELPQGDPKRKYKYRVVFQGNRVVNQHYDAAIFQDLGSSPATIEASRAADAYGCAPGHVIEAADAEQAYVQADMKGTPPGRAYLQSSGGAKPKPWSAPSAASRRLSMGIPTLAPIGRRSATPTQKRSDSCPLDQSGLRATFTKSGASF